MRLFFFGENVRYSTLETGIVQYCERYPARQGQLFPMVLATNNGSRSLLSALDLHLEH